MTFQVRCYIVRVLFLCPLTTFNISSFKSHLIWLSLKLWLVTFCITYQIIIQSVITLWYQLSFCGRLSRRSTVMIDDLNEATSVKLYLWLYICHSSPVTFCLLRLYTTWHDCGLFHLYEITFYLTASLKISLSPPRYMSLSESLPGCHQVHLLRTAGDEVTIIVRFLREVPSFLKLPLGKSLEGLQPAGS